MVKAKEMGKKRANRRTPAFPHLLVPIDFSDLSLQTLRFTRDSLQRDGAVLTLLYVVPADYGWLGIGREELRELDASLQKQAAGRLRQLAEATFPRSKKVNLEIRVGRPGEEIVIAAQELDVDVIVLSRHSRRGFDRYLLGSVADRVARTAACPVLLLPPEKLKRLPKQRSRRIVSKR